MNGRDLIEDMLARTATRLAGKGLLQPGDMLSQRIPEQDSFVSLEIPSIGENVPAFHWTGLSATPSGLHHRIYAARPDVGAIATGAMKWTGVLARLGLTLPAVFDEQVRHLGIEVRRLPLRSTDGKLMAMLANGANACCLDDLSLCLGMGPERLLLNIEILEKCAESFALAHCASRRVRRIPWLVRLIANRRLVKDEKDAAMRHLRGERSIMKTSY